jgi:hypothetical protein
MFPFLVDQNIQRRVATSWNCHLTPFLDAMVYRQARKRIQALEEWAVQRDRETAELSARFSRGAADFARLADTVEAIRASGPRPSPAVLPSPPTPARSAPFVPVTKPPNAPSSAVAPDPRPPVSLPPLHPRALLP